MNPYNIAGYNLIYNEGDLNQNDGLVVYVKSAFSFEHNIISVGPTKVLKVAIGIHNNTRIVILACYRSPSQENYNPKIPEFINNLDTLLRNNRKGTEQYCIFVGDINIDLLDSDHKTIDYISTLSEYGFVSTINKPTRLNSCLDHLFLYSKSNKNLENIIPLVIKTGITDHDAIALQIVIDNKGQKKPSERVTKHVNYQKLKETVSKISWDSIRSCHDPDDATEKFISIIQENIDKCLYYKRHNRKNTKIAPWVTNALLRSINEKKRLFQLTKKIPNDRNILSHYRLYRNKLNALILTTKKIIISQKLPKIPIITNNCGM